MENRERTVAKNIIFKFLHPSSKTRYLIKYAFLFSIIIGKPIYKTIVSLCICLYFDIKNKIHVNEYVLKTNLKTTVNDKC